uniref:Uncharacterized protein n=1 Tax=Fagus sylvatica TaxID=28930 RepID=A0A2N9G8S3_FAGSY
MCTTYLDSLSCPSQAFYDIPIVLEGENEEDDENHGVGNSAPIQQAINEDSTSLHRADVPAVELDAEELRSIVVDEVYAELKGSMGRGRGRELGQGQGRGLGQGRGQEHIGQEMLLPFTDQEEDIELGSDLPSPPNGQPHEVIDSTLHSASPGAPGASCSNATTFTTRVGYILRNYAEFHDFLWTKVPEDHIQILKNRLVCDFTFDLNRKEDSKCLEKASSSIFSNACTKYSKHVKTYAENEFEVAKADVPTDITNERWHKLCDLFKDQKWKDKSNRNAKNRKQLKCNHTCGSKLFISTLEQKKKGREDFNGLEWYKAAHVRKDGSFVTPTCEENYNKMLQLLADENVDLSEDAIVSQVLGTRSSYATGQGKFVIPTTFSSRSHYQREDDSELALCKQELAETKERVVHLEDKIEQNQV